VEDFDFAGRKAEKKKTKNVHVQELTDKQKNPKAFTFNSAVRAERRFRRYFLFYISYVIYGS
jgi:hypothetical protein